MNKTQLLKHFKSEVYCRIAPSYIQGVGVVAIRNIPKNINPFRGSPDNYKLIPFEKKELSGVRPEVFRMISDFFASEKDTILIPEMGLNALDLSFFMNHSKNPNVKVGTNEDFYTTREIKKGEELTTDYTTFSD